jgi:hypothetical protein
MPGSRTIIIAALAALTIGAGVPVALAGGLIDRKADVDQQLEDLRSQVRDRPHR